MMGMSVSSLEGYFMYKGSAHFFDSVFPTQVVLTQVRKQAECDEPASMFLHDFWFKFLLELLP